MRHVREAERQEALESYGIVGTQAEAFYNSIVNLAAAACDCPIALVTFVDNDRQWFKAALGLDVAETSREISFCTHAVQQGQIFVVEDALRDPRFVDNALVVGAPFIRFYAGEPFFASNGLPLGTVCVIDRKPRQLTPVQASALGTLAREVELQLSLRRSLVAAERASDQKSQLAAMLTHDLRNPLQVAVIRANEMAMRYGDRPESKQGLADLSWALQTMQRMALDMLDLCAAQAGHLLLRRGPVDLQALCAEIEATATTLASPGQRVQVISELARSVIESDRNLVRRMIDNLLSNALKYSPPDGEVQLVVRSTPDGALRISVRDQGPGIPHTERERIFDMYARLERDRDHHVRTSYGLGLPFCRVAAEALKGRVWTESTSDQGAVFHVELPPLERTEARAPSLATAE